MAKTIVLILFFAFVAHAQEEDQLQVWADDQEWFEELDRNMADAERIESLYEGHLERVEKI